MKKHIKTIKLAIINFVTLLIGLGLLSGSVSLKNAQAARFETIPSVQITHLGNFRGQYLTVLYAIGSRPFISTDSSQLTLSQVKESRRVVSDFAACIEVSFVKRGAQLFRAPICGASYAA